MRSRNELHDGLNRMVKMALDTGEATTLHQAHELFSRYRLHVALGEDAAKSASHQAAALTAVNTGRRCFLGGVTVSGPLSSPLLVPWRNCRSVGDAVRDLQGHTVTEQAPSVPTLLIGDATPEAMHAPLHLRATVDGWTAAVAPIGGRLPDRSFEFTPAGVLAGALGVSEVFQFLRGTNPAAGGREIGLSLWKPEQLFRNAERGPSVTHLLARLWLIGLGHLGQALLWTLGLLPYADAKRVGIVLQDFDELVEANDSTSMLTNMTLIGQRKTRSMAAWCEQRGFRTTVVERRFAANFTLASDEPAVAVCGVDNPHARAALEDVGFARIVEAGLGAGPSEYLAFQVHSFPARKSARARWDRMPTAESSASVLDRPAYRALRHDGLDECGLVQLAGRTVGAPFVGAVASTLVTAELVRIAQGFHRYDLVDGSLRSLDSLTAISALPCSPFNPGTEIAAAL